MIEITVFGGDIWFQKGKPVSPPNRNFDYSSHLRCRTIRKARRISKGILNKWPDVEVHILRWKLENGKRLVKEEVWERRTK